MASELSDASLKLVLSLEDAKEAVDEIQAEQERRRGLRRPGHVAPDEVQVVRPDLGRSAVTGEREGPLPTPGGDARPSGFPAGDVLDAGDEVQRLTGRAQRVVGAAESVFGSPGSGAAALGTELARGGTMAAARAAGVAGPVGAALAAGAMVGRGLYEQGPTIGGLAHAIGGPLGEALVSQALTGSPGGLQAWRAGWDAVAARVEAIDQTHGELVEIAAAQARVGGRLDSPRLAGLGRALYSAHAQSNVEQRAEQAAGERLRAGAAWQFTSDGLDRFIGQ